MADSSAASIAAALDRAAEAYESLAERAEAVDDEWQYIQDVRDAYLPSIRALPSTAAALAGADAVAGAEAVAAIDELIAEADLIVDPHKAIDWLSTFPHILALAVGGDVDEAAGSEPPGDRSDASEAADESSGSNEDSPFGFLLRGDR